MVNDRDLWSKTSLEFFPEHRRDERTDGRTDGSAISVLTAPAAPSCWETEAASSCPGAVWSVSWKWEREKPGIWDRKSHGHVLRGVPSSFWKGRWLTRARNSWFIQVYNWFKTKFSPHAQMLNLDFTASLWIRIFLKPMAINLKTSGT